MDVNEELKFLGKFIKKISGGGGSGGGGVGLVGGGGVRKFQDDISNIHTYIHTDKPKPICHPLFQSWGHKEVRRQLNI